MNKNSTKKAYLAGGCFWGMEELFRGLPGVLDTKACYTGGYSLQLCWTTGHVACLSFTF